VIDMDLLIAGFGVVGQGFAEVLASKMKRLESVLGKRIRIIGVFDSRSIALSREGLDPLELIRAKSSTGMVGSERHDGDTVGIVDEVEHDLLIEVTPTDIDSGEPAFGHMRASLSAGRDVITCNKGPLALRFKDLSDIAEQNGSRLRFEGAVGGAMPVINVAREILMGESISKIRGILNGTCNFILSRMGEEGLPLNQALKEAQQLGYAESDPTYDIDGIDSACKVAILANAIMGMDVTYNDVEVTGIRGINEDAISLANGQRKVIRLIGEISEDRVEVSPRLVPIGHPLSIGGTLNMVQMKTDIAGEITVAGRGAGKMETASAVLSDLTALIKGDKQG
jgi:homoserine dehydrogenase